MQTLSHCSWYSSYNNNPVMFGFLSRFSRLTSLFLSIDKKCSATWTGKMLASSLRLYACRCSISSFSSVACSFHKKSSLEVASICCPWITRADTNDTRTRAVRTLMDIERSWSLLKEKLIFSTDNFCKVCSRTRLVPKPHLELQTEMLGYRKLGRGTQRWLWQAERSAECLSLTGKQSWQWAPITHKEWRTKIIWLVHDML